jgi:hypothetical protein
MLTQFAGNFRNAAAAIAAAQAAPAAAETAETAAPAPTAPPPVKELNALALMWTVIKGWFAGLFGKKA